MRRTARRPVNEAGQGSVEAALATLVLVAAFLAALYVVFAAYGLNAASLAVQSASWNVDAEQVLAAGDKNGLIEQAIAKAVPGTTASDVKVTGATATARTERAGTSHASKGDGLTVYSERKCVDVSFTVSYTCPVVPHATFTKDVKHTLVADSKAEVG